MKRMMSLFILVAALALTGCMNVSTQTRAVDLNDPYAAKRDYLARSSERKVSINDVNWRARRQDANVTLADARAVKARNLHVAPDSTSWFDADSGLFECVATAEVLQVRFVRQRRGKRLLAGMLAGAAAGAAVGAMFGYAEGDDECCVFCDRFELCFSAEDKAVINAVLLGSLGALMGAFIGGSRNQQVYRFEAPASQPAVAGVARQQLPGRQ